MPLIKLGEATLISASDIQDTNVVLSDIDLQITERMKKFAQELKTIAPQASDFLYFTAVMMHAAEASLYDEEGKLKKDASGNDVVAHWETTSNGGIKWVCSDPNIKPYKNANADIFPASELKLAYKKWIGRPLCLDHKSSSVDMIRGVIVDTYWDEPKQRIIALCALDKVNYPDLARKVTSGYATNVSMGTAVGRAVCTEEGCHRIAKVESDFCHHMKSRSCYGEINLDLSPIELSIVVTGADPKAKVKHIIAKDLSDARAAADALQTYIDKKISLASHEVVDESDISNVKEELSRLNDKVSKLAASLEANGGESEEAEIQPEAKVSEASESSLVDELELARQKLSSINETIQKINDLLPRGASNTARTNDKEITMTQEKLGYFQGTEEPTAPGKQQYTPDPLNEKVRTEHKHMVGKAPFPGVGAVDQLYPGDAEIKKKLQRLADLEKKEQLRRAAVEDFTNKTSLGYFQGTEEPTAPGKPQYPVDPLNEKVRTEHKHMVGKAPFPGVGAVDQLYPGDLELKQKLSRAGLKATFKKAADQGGKLNKSASTWNVYAGETLILTASVDEITHGNADSLYDAIATKEFGKSMIKSIVSEGFEAAREKFKGKVAQDMGMSPAPADDVPGTGMDVPGEGVVDAPEEDDVQSAIMQAQDSLEKALTLLNEGADAIAEDASEIPPVAAASSTDDELFKKASAHSMRRTVNNLLGEGFKETIGKLNLHKKELTAANSVLSTKYASMSPEKKTYFVSLVNDALLSARKTAFDAKGLMQAFVSYAQGTNALIEKSAQVVSDGGPLIINDEIVDDTNDAGTSEEIVMPEMIITPGGGESDAYSEIEKQLAVEPDAQITTPEDMAGVGFADDDNHASVSVKPEDLSKLPPDTKITVDAEDLSTSEGRALYRSKLAQTGLQFMKLPSEAHKSENGILSGFDQPKNNLGKFEKIEEISKAMQDLAKLSPKAKKQAEQIIKLVSEGKVDASLVDSLVAQGVDKDAVNYYKKYYGEAKDAESNEFAKLLVEEKKKAAAAEELEVHKLKVKRAYELAYEMSSKGMIDLSQVSTQVDDILTWNDDSFNSVKRIVASSEAKVKTASIPQVGLVHSDEIYLPQQSPAQADLIALMEAHFASKRF